MLLKNDAFHTQTRVDATKMAVANFDGTFELVTELANKLAAEPDAECTGRGRKIFFVFRKNTTKRCFKEEMS